MSKSKPPMLRTLTSKSPQVIFTLRNLIKSIGKAIATTLSDISGKIAKILKESWKKFPCTFLIITCYQNFVIMRNYSIHGFSIMTHEKFQMEHMCVIR